MTQRPTATEGSRTRFDRLAEGLVMVLRHQVERDGAELERSVADLRAAIGLQERT